ncbi:putative NUDIX hydrolase [compost metagenome]
MVGLVTPPFELRADPSEVAEIFEVPLAFLMDGVNHQRLSVELPGGRRSFYAMPYERFYIWGATAGMLRNLFHLLRA